MKRASWPDVTGPLGPYAAGFRKELTRLGYSVWAASAHMYLMAHLSDWLDEREQGPAGLSSALVDEFLADRHASGHVARLTRQGLAPLLGYLQSLELLPNEAARGRGPVGRLLAEFVEHLRTERGLAPRTTAGYLYISTLFLTSSAPEPGAEGCGLQRLGGAEVNAFLLSECARRSVGSANNVATALRTFLRFLHLRGYTAASLAECVPKGAAWRDSGRSKALGPDDVALLLASCDRRNGPGRRDFAILTVLARLGLRANEVVCLRLEDLDWRAGELTVMSKGGHRDRLPVPVDVGRAIAEYCRRGRPHNGHRELFLHARAPYGGLSPDAVTKIVRQACRRAGLPPVGAIGCGTRPLRICDGQEPP